VHTEPSPNAPLSQVQYVELNFTAGELQVQFSTDVDEMGDAVLPGHELQVAPAK
jgi:hypothetical protein